MDWNYVYKWFVWPFLQVPVGKKVMVDNVRMGITYRILQIYIIYVLVQGFLLDNSWMLEKQAPQVFLNVEAQAQTKRAKRQRQTDSSHPFCSDPASLAYTIPNSNKRKKGRSMLAHGCTALVDGQEFMKGDQALAIPTFFEDNWVHQTSGAKCSLMRRCCGKGSAAPADCDVQYPVFKYFGIFDTGFGKSMSGDDLCSCTCTRRYYVKGPTGINVSLKADYKVTTSESGSTSDPRDGILTIVTEPSPTSSSVNLNDLPHPHATSLLQSSVEEDDDEYMRSLEDSEEDGEDEAAEVAQDIEADEDIVDVPSMSLLEENKLYAEVDATGTIRRHHVQQEQHEYDTPSPTADDRRRRRSKSAEATTGTASMRRDSASSASAQTASKSPGHVDENSRVPQSNASRDAMGGLTSTLTDSNPTLTLFEPGKKITMTLDDWIRHAQIFNGPPISSLTKDGQSPLDLENSYVRKSSDPNGKTFPDFRTTGLELVFDLEFQNKAIHRNEKVKHDGTILVITVTAKPGWEVAPVTHTLYPLEPLTGSSIQVQRVYHVVRIRFNEHGTFGQFSWAAILSAVTSAIIAIQIPGFIMAFIALFCMWTPSSMIWECAYQRLHLGTMSTGFVARSINTIRSFKGSGKSVNPGTDVSLAPATTGPGKGGPVKGGPVKGESINKKELKDDLKEVLDIYMPDGELTDPEADYLIEALTGEFSETHTDMKPSELTEAALSNEPLRVADLVDYLNPNRKSINPIEWIFCPPPTKPALLRAARLLARKRGEKNRASVTKQLANQPASLSSTAEQDKAGSKSEVLTGGGQPKSAGSRPR